MHDFKTQISELITFPESNQMNIKPSCILLYIAQILSQISTTSSNHSYTQIYTHTLVSKIMAHSFISLLLKILSIHLISSVGAVYNIVDFGAKSDGQTDSASALLSAWNAACQSTNPSTIYVPNGKFLVGHLTFMGPCTSNKIDVQLYGTIVAPSNYANFGKVGEWIVFDKVVGLSVYGGTFDGSGSGLWACKASGGSSCPNGATVSALFQY
jgi:polygalacturonase